MPHIGWFHDDTVYWTAARALAEGSGYRILNLPQQPFQTKYPPLYPFLLAGVWKLFPAFPENLRPAMLLAWVMLPLFIVAARSLLRDLGLPDPVNWFLAGALALSPVTVLLSVTLMTDLLYCLFVFSVLVVLQRAQGARAALLAGLLGGLAYLTRTSALVLFGAGVLWLLWRRRYGLAVVFAGPMVLAMFGWGRWVAGHSNHSSDLAVLYYTDYLRYQLYGFSWAEAPIVLARNLAFFLAAITQLLTSQVGGIFWRLFAVAAIAGAYRLGRRSGLHPYHVFAALLTMLHLAWPGPPDGRYLLPIAPLLAAGLWTELAHLAGLLRGAWEHGRRILAASLGGVLCTSLAAAAFYLAGTLFSFLPQTFEARRALRASEGQAYQWITQNLPADSRFVAYDDVLFSLHTARSAVGVRAPFLHYYLEDYAALVRLHTEIDGFAQAHGSRYLLATADDYYRGEVPFQYREAVRAGLAQRYGFRRLYSNGAVAVYELASDARAQR
jgi:hypothetical protein